MHKKRVRNSYVVLQIKKKKYLPKLRNAMHFRWPKTFVIDSVQTCEFWIFEFKLKYKYIELSWGVHPLGTDNPLLISTGFLKYPLEMKKKKNQLELKKKNQLVSTEIFFSTN